MVKTKADYPLILTASDVQEIMNCKRTSAYQFINRASAYMKGKGQIPPKETVNRAVIPRDLFFELYGI